jgi:hypothetical protein
VVRYLTESGNTWDATATVGSDSDIVPNPGNLPQLGTIKHFAGCPWLRELQKEPMVHNFEITDKVVKVESKDKINTRLFSSRDILDAVVIALYVALRNAKPTFRVRTPADD